MKKSYLRILALVMAGVLIALPLAGCSSDKDGGDTTTTAPAASGEDTTAEAKPVENYYAAYDLSEYIALGAYKGLEYKSMATQYKDADVLNEAKELFLHYANYGGPRMDVVQTPGKNTVAEGDAVVFDYECTAEDLSEETLANMKAEGADIEVGRSMFVDGFDEGMIGKKIGVRFDITANFPEGYNEELGGKTVNFSCMIHTIGTYSITDEKVSELMTGLQIEGVTTAKELYEYLRVEYMAPTDDSNNLFKTALANATIHKIPEAELKLYEDDMKSRAEYLDSTEGTSREQYLKENKIDMTWDEYVEDQISTGTRNELFVYAVAAAEGLEVTDQELAAAAAEYREYNQLDETIDDETILNYYYGSERIAVVSILYQKVMDFIYKNAVSV